MKSAIMITLALLAVTPVRGAEVSPVQKVLEMLSDLQAKVLAEGQDAQKIYEEFSEWCEDTARNLGFEIKTGKAEVVELTATIEDATAKIAALETKVEELASGIQVDTKDLKAATEIRDKEAADFAAEESELTQVIDMLQRAIAILEREMAKGASMLQLKNAGSVEQALSAMVKASMFSSADASRLTSLVQSSQEPEDSDDEEEAALSAPDPAVYEGHSGGIIETLQELLEKAEDQLSEARKTETSNLHTYEQLKQSLEDEIKFAEEDLAKSKAGLAENGEIKATAEGELTVTQKDLDADIKEMAELHTECMTKAQEFEDTTKSRGEELKALATAKKVISESTGGAEAQTYALDQVSFLQIRSRLSSDMDLANMHVVRHIRDLARKQNSPQLTQLASRISSAIRFSERAGEDPFAKVKGLITDMIEKLSKEAEADATQKAYCDKEMGETNAKKDDKEAELEKLTTQIEAAEAKSAKLKEEVATLQKELAELAKMQAEMDKLREEEKAAYEKNRPEMEQGLEGVKLALKVLREYYAKEDKAHEAAEGAGGTIIGLLEVVESDFTKLLAEIIATEETAAKEYDEQTKENEVTKTTKDQDVKYKTKEFTELDKAVSEMSSDKESVQAELDSINEALEKLKEMCIAKVEPYEERVKRREAEIAGLKEALQILEGAAVLLQRSAKHTLRGMKA